jgi:hypothetical protein
LKKEQLAAGLYICDCEIYACGLVEGAISKREHCSYSARSRERGAGAGEVNGMEG